MRTVQPYVIELRGVTSPSGFFVTMGFFLYLLIAGTVACAVFLLEKLGVIMDDAGDGWADLHTWGFAAATVILGVLSAISVRAVLRRAPMQLARRECVVSSEGIEMIRHPKWWAPEERMHLAWGDIHAITTDTELLSKSNSKRKEPHRTMIISLVDVAPGTTDFVVAPPGFPMPGGDQSRHRLWIRGISSRLRGAKDRDMLAISEAIEHVRPGLFHRGVNDDEWFPPPPASPDSSSPQKRNSR